MNSEGLDALIITLVGLMALAFGWFIVALVQDRMRPIEAPETPETPKGEGNENAHSTSNRPMTPDLVWSK